MASGKTILPFTPATATPAVSSNAVTLAPSNPTGNNSNAGLMQGLALPLVSKGRPLVILLAGYLRAGATGVKTASVQIRTGTGAAPANGAAATGTVQGPEVEVYVDGTAGIEGSAAVSALVLGLVNGTTYWIDVRLRSLAALGLVELRNAVLTAFEV